MPNIDAGFSRTLQVQNVPECRTPGHGPLICQHIEVKGDDWRGRSVVGGLEVYMWEGDRKPSF